MPRARREWSAMRSDVRELIRETVASASFWSDALLLILFNQQMDSRSMELAEQHEGWMTETFETDVVSNQADYALPEGTGRVKRVVWVDNSEPGRFEQPLQRRERWSEPTYQTNSGSVRDSLPTYRLVGNLIRLEPTPRTADARKLFIDLEALPERLSADSSKLDLRYPAEMETLLIYDTALAALDVEDSQGNVDPNKMSGLRRMREEYSRRFFDFTAVRSFGRVYSAPFYLGD